MEFKQAKSLIVKLNKQIKFLSTAVIGLILCLVFLIVLLWHQSNKENLILVPAGLERKAQLTENGVSASYLEAIAMMLVNDRLNVTPESVAGSNQRILEWVDAQFYPYFKKQLGLDAISIKAGKFSSTFYLKQLRSDPKQLVVVAQGILKRWVGERLISNDEKKYRLSFSRNRNILMLKSFQELTSS